MKFCALLLFLALTRPVPAQEAAVPKISYRSVPDFLKLPSDLYLGEVAGVSLNSKGHIFVFSRGQTSGPAYGASAAQLLEFSGDGKFIREIGHNLYAWSFAHSVKVDKDDNIWVADKGSDMVIKFNPEGQVVMVFGRKQEASDEGTEPLRHPKPPLPPVDGMFRQVTDMAGTRLAIRISVTATSTLASLRSINTATGSSRGASPGTAPDSSTLRIALRWTRTGASTWRTAVTAASRCSTTRASSCARSPSTCPLIRTPVRRSATSRVRPQARWRPARPGRFASRRGQIKCCSALMDTRAGSTSSPWTARFWACSENPANNSSSSVGSTKSRARLKPNSTSPNC